MKKTSDIKTMANIEANDCRWPLGDPRNADFHFCGAQKVLGRPYCQEHYMQSFVASKPRLAPVLRAPALLPARAA